MDIMLNSNGKQMSNNPLDEWNCKLSAGSETLCALYSTVSSIATYSMNPADPNELIEASSQERSSLNGRLVYDRSTMISIFHECKSKFGTADLIIKKFYVKFAEKSREPLVTIMAIDPNEYQIRAKKVKVDKSSSANIGKSMHTSPFMMEETVICKAIFILNKLNTSNLVKLSKEFTSCGVLKSLHLITRSADMIIKCAMGPFYAVYAELCSEIMKQEDTVSEAFRMQLLEHCQLEFESASYAICTTGEPDDLLKKRFSGVLMFTGQLLIKNIINVKVICASCLDILMEWCNKEVELICFAELFLSIGPLLEKQYADKAKNCRTVTKRAKYLAVLPSYLKSIEGYARDHSSGRVRHVMRDIIERQSNSWKPLNKVQRMARATLVEKPSAAATISLAGSSSSSERISPPLEIKSATGSEMSKEEKCDCWKQVLALREQRLCIICEDIEKTVVLMPCRHMCVCVACSEHKLLTKCPLCMASIEDKISVYL